MTDIHPAIANHYDGMNSALHDRDRLASLVVDLQNELTVAKKQVDYLTERLEHLTKDRDYYYRKAFAYTNTLVNTRNQLQNMLDLADHEAESPAPALLPKASNIGENDG